MVLKMKRIENVIVTDVLDISTIYSPKNKRYTIKNRQCFGLSFSASGSICYKINGAEYISHPGCCVILPQNGSYTLHGTKAGYFPLINFTAGNVPALSDIIKIPLENPAFYLNEYKKIKRASLCGCTRFEKMQILYNILKHLSEEENATHPSVKAAASFIEKNYANHTLTNEMIAESIGISEVYLRKLFLNFLKTSPKQYVTDVRINHAKQLLTENLYSVSEIADMCGYTNIYHFSKRFKSSVNITPSEYKAAFFKTPSEL